MEFPFGHHNHHHRRHDDGGEEFPPPGGRPPSSYNDPPPPQVSHVYHTSHEGGPPPPMEPNYGHSPHYPQREDTYGRPNYPNYGGGSYNPPPPVADYYGGPPPPPTSAVQHVSHEGVNESHRPPPISDYHTGPPPPTSAVHHVSHESESHHRFQPHVPSFFNHQTTPPHPELIDKPTCRVYTRADPNYSLTVRDGKVILARSDPSDPFQHWYKDEKYSTKVKDEEGFPSFALVNKATGLAMKHSTGASHPVQLIPYDPSVLDASILWTESRDVADGYRAVRMVNNIRLNLDAWNADKDHGGIRDGTTVALWEWWKGENLNQRWKIIPY